MTSMILGSTTPFNFPTTLFGVVYDSWKIKCNLTNKIQVFKREKKIRDYLKTFDNIDYFKLIKFRSDFHTENCLIIFDGIMEVLEKLVTCTEDYALLNGRLNQIITSMLGSICRSMNEDEELAYLIDLLTPE